MNYSFATNSLAASALFALLAQRDTRQIERREAGVIPSGEVCKFEIVGHQPVRVVFRSTIRHQNSIRVDGPRGGISQAQGEIDRARVQGGGRLGAPPGQDAEATAEDDGLLEHREIHGLSLTACDLAVLSACRTSIGPGRPLEARSTLARAFLTAGVQRVVCSLWEVNDDSTSLLIAALFRNLEAAWKSGQPVDYAAALHEARKDVRKQQTYRAPYYWAPFILIGPADEVTEPAGKKRLEAGQGVRESAG